MTRSLRSWLWKVPLDQEVDEEIAFHIEMRTRELVERGVDPRMAREMVLARIGDRRRLRRTCIDLGRKRDRQMQLTQRFDELRQDVTFAFRQLRGSPGFTLVATLTLALGIGANGAIFALADATILRPLPFRSPERLVRVEEWGPQQGGRSRIELLNFRDWAERNRTFDAMAAMWVPAAGGGPTTIGPDGTAEMVPAHNVTAAFFDVLGITPIAGRTFVAADEAADQPVVVLSEGFWRTRFAADSTLIGRDITLEGRPFTVIGVVPSWFRFTPDAGFASSLVSPSMWTLLPWPRDEGEASSRGQCGVCRFLQVVGRLKPGASVDAARSDLTAIAERLAERNGGSRPRRVAVTRLDEVLIGRDLRLTSLLFLAVVGFVLLLASANVAHLVLARAAVRTRELAVRAALGAGRLRLVRQLLTESLMLTSAGGLLGITIGAVVLGLAPSLMPAGLLPDLVAPRFDGRVLAFCAGITFAVGVLVGLAPAWQVTGASLVQHVTSASRTSTRGGGRLRHLLVVGEVAAAVLVLCGAGLLLRTLLVLDGFDPGYRAQRERLLTADFVVPALRPDGRYPTRESLAQFYDDIEREVGALPGVRGAAWATSLPLGGSQLGLQSFAIVGDPPPPDGIRPQADLQIVSASYFQTMDLAIVAGRGLTDDDRGTSLPVCLVNEAFVRRHLQGRTAIGTRVEIGGLPGGPTAREIVGVVRQVKGRPDEREELVQVYLPMRQHPWPEAYLVVRAGGGRADALALAVRQAVARVDKLMPVKNVITLDAVARNATSRHRFRAALVATFGGLALVLAMVGVFGVLAYSVQQRWREFGVRIALGATPSTVLRLVFGQAVRVVAAGTLIGVAAAAAVGQSIRTFLFGVQPLDPITFGAVVLVLGLTAAIATAVPALRAARVDPVEAFRSE